MRDQIKDEIKSWLIKWFDENSDADAKEINEKTDQNYLELGWIDSLKFIMFVADVEKFFKIRFKNDEFQDRSFGTIDGLAEIASKRISEQR